jgi:hypothetical protein
MQSPFVLGLVCCLDLGAAHRGHRDDFRWSFIRVLVLGLFYFAVDFCLDNSRTCGLVAMFNLTSRSRSRWKMQMVFLLV